MPPSHIYLFQSTRLANGNWAIEHVASRADTRRHRHNNRVGLLLLLHYTLHCITFLTWPVSYMHTVVLQKKLARLTCFLALVSACTRFLHWIAALFRARLKRTGMTLHRQPPQKTCRMSQRRWTRRLSTDYGTPRTLSASISPPGNHRTSIVALPIHGAGCTMQPWQLRLCQQASFNLSVVEVPAAVWLRRRAAAQARWYPRIKRLTAPRLYTKVRQARCS